MDAGQLLELVNHWGACDDGMDFVAKFAPAEPLSDVFLALPYYNRVWFFWLLGRLDICLLWQFGRGSVEVVALDQSISTAEQSLIAQFNLNRLAWRNAREAAYETFIMERDALNERYGVGGIPAPEMLYSPEKAALIRQHQLAITQADKIHHEADVKAWIGYKTAILPALEVALDRIYRLLVEPHDTHV